MSIEIKLLMIAFLNESVIVASWGITNVKVQEEKLEFDVNGLLYKGNIIISVHKNCYSVEINGEKFICKLDNIVTILDAKIERTNNYDKDLLEILTI